MSDGLTDLTNRIRKRAKHLRKWARRSGVSCFRLYDHDLPDQPLVIDWYENTAVVWLHQRTRDDTPAARLTWEAAALEAIAEALDCQAGDLVVKSRGRQQDRQHGGQYQRNATTGSSRLVQESGLTFEVNLHDYLDTGLFLDHRETRRRFASEAQGKRVLNCFAYTGAFSVYAATAGAASTRSLDLSATYCQWARRNLEHNGITNRADHRITRTDVLAWLEEPPTEEYDQIICDPPTFSNSKRMRRDWVVGRDHPWLLEQLYRRLAPNGTCWFSTNDRRFELAPEAKTYWSDVCEITAHTIPEDYSRRRPHRCWLLSR